MGAPAVHAGDWTGATSSDWNTAANWSDNTVPSGESAVIDTTSGNIATISSTTAATPTDILVGIFGAGRLDQIAGTAQTGSGNFLFVGDNGTGTYNLADTTGTGGTLTGYAIGSGSMTAGYLQAGDPFGTGGGTAVINVNTTGSLNTTYDLNLGRGNATAVMNVDNGTVAAGGILRVGADGTGFGTLNQSGGAISSMGNTIIADSSPVSGIYNLSNGTLAVGDQLWVGSNGTGTFNQSGGTVTTTNWLVLSRFANGNGTYNLMSGVVNATTSGGNVSIASEGGTGVLNVSGGTFNALHELWVGEGYGNDTATATLTVSGTGVVNVSDTTDGLRLAINGADPTNDPNRNVSGTVNLNGGTINTAIVTNGGGTGTFNFNGGTLKATQNNSNFLTVTTAQVRDGGGTVDNNGTSILIAQPLVHSTISGDSATDGGLTFTGSGTTTLTGVNTFTGTVVVNGGTLVAAAPFSANQGTFDNVSGITVNTGATLQTSINALFGYDGSMVKPITVNAGGTLTNTYGDVAVGNVTLNGGTMSTAAGTFGGSYGYGSWRFEFGTGLYVTDDSTVSANFVKFAGGAPISVAAGKTLNFIGSITDDNGGTSSVVKTGLGTLTLAGANAYSGGSAVNAGTLLVTGSLGAGQLNNAASDVTVNNSGTLGGTGSISGAISLQSGGKVSPGTVGIGTLSAATMTWAGSASNASSGGTYDLSTSGNSSDEVALSGTLTKDSSGGVFYTFDFTGGLAGTTYTLVTFTGTTNFVATDFAIASDLPQYAGTFSIDSLGGGVSGVDFTLTAVPEPTSASLFVVGIVGALSRRRRRPEAAPQA